MAFFPKVLQGPIERAGDLLPQLKRPFVAGEALWRAGALLFAWGLFKKVVVADRAAPIVDTVYGSVTAYDGVPLAAATYLYAVQLYCDFSGYTDMALGVALGFGVRLTQNFDNPYAARSVAEFWRRWHISFSRWIFDYVFKPLQFAWRDYRTAGVIGALVATFFVSGLWHGAGWTFVLWGLLHGTYMAVSVTTRAVRRRWHDWFWKGRPGLGHAWQVFVTAHLVVFSWILFRAESLGDAAYVVTHLAGGISGTRAVLLQAGAFNLLVLVLGTAVVAWVDMIGRGRRIENVLVQPLWLRWPAYYALAVAILVLGADAQAPFIYFQF
jgi:alginate O-acetyltransferase complex protein AlgI